MKNKQKLFFLPGYLLAIGLTINFLLPVIQGEINLAQEAGRREMGKIKTYESEKTIRYIVEETLKPDGYILTTWGGQVCKDPQRAEDCERFEETVNQTVAMVEKASYESKSTDSYTIFFHRDCDEWARQLKTLVVNYKHRCEEKFGTIAHTAYKGEQAKNGNFRVFDPEVEWREKMRAELWQQWAITGLYIWMLWILFLSLAAKFVHGFNWKQMRRELYRIPFLAVVGPIAAVGFLFAKPIERIVIWAKVAGAASWAAMKIVASVSAAFAKLLAVRAQALAYGLATMLACVISCVAANAQSSFDSCKKRQNNVVWVDESVLSNLGRPSLPDWLLQNTQKNGNQSSVSKQLDVRTTFVPDEGPGAFTRFTIAHNERFGLMSESIVSSRATPTGYALNAESVFGTALMKSRSTTVNLIGGGSIAVSHNNTTKNTSMVKRLLLGLQVYTKQKWFGLEIPVFRLQEPVASGTEKRSLAFTHRTMFDIGTRWKIGQETNLTKIFGGIWQKAIHITPRFRPNRNWPWLEAGVGYDFNAERYMFRSRILFNW